MWPIALFNYFRTKPLKKYFKSYRWVSRELQKILEYILSRSAICHVYLINSESLGRQADQTNQSYRKSVLNIHWKDWCWSWNSNTLATWCEELTHWKKPWYWEILKAGGEGDNRGWGGWMASPTWWTWVWASSRSWWWIGKPGMLQLMGSQRAGHDWETFIMYIEWVKSLSRVQLFATPWTIAYQAPPSMGFSRQEYWSGVPFPSPGDLPDPGIESVSPAL